MDELIEALTDGDSLALRALKDGSASAPVVAAALGQMMGSRHIRSASLFNIITAVMALRADDAGGTLTIKVPPKSNGVLEAHWTSVDA